VKRSIAVVTGARAEFGLLVPIVAALARRRDVDVGFVITGVHLAGRYGRTRNDVVRAGFPVWAAVPMYATLGASFAQLPAAIAKAVRGLDRVFAARKPALVLVLGDRPEAFAAATAAYFGRIPLAHVHGGEKSDFHLDDATRHAITRLAHLHFPATRQSAARLRRMGEEPWRIHLTGAPGLDALRAMPRPERDAVARRHGIDPARPFVTLLFHPETGAWRRAGAQARTILAELARARLQTIALYPNGDPGSDAIIRAIGARGGRIAAAAHLPRDEFAALLAATDALVGNSSCGLIEGSYLGTPVLNLGERNVGREHGANVVFAPVAPAAIRRGLATVLSARFRRRAREAPCPWGDGRAGEKIARILATVPLDARVLAKRLAE
jgi:GDP/UDP-N,N'-diacetylbacillosamine 2-epimerase (hydrolysing)